MRKKSTGLQGRQERGSDQSKDQSERKHVADAHEQAERDIQDDPEFSAHSPNDDLDEAESARLGDETDLI